ncbi:hypothetical protein F5148DRAFT_1164818 [Russula earlei]|uniref:Uncharacterized protein n=1 Tax=Russula earlei TaxID=71964 RepID=A0ACC0UKH9_9AGAM|nr:hypothetical protein F5148DRAFT_1164818 [Russula earlei]
MDLPSSRELELEALLRKKDSQLAELTDEANALRQHLSTQPSPSLTEPFVRSSSTTRAKLLQEENDELYELLKSSETGKLKEEVRSLRRVVNRLETALRGGTHMCFRDELEKSYEIVIPPTRPVNSSSRHAHQGPPHMQTASSGNPNGNGHGRGSGSGTVNKVPPTAPRAHKKPRLADTRGSPVTASNALPRVQTQTRGRSASHHMDSPDNSPLQSPDTRKAPSGKFESAAEEEAERVRGRERERERGRSRDRERGREAERRTRHRSPAAAREPRDRDRNKERDRARERDRPRERERERDRDRTSRRGVGHGRKGRSGGGTGGSGYNGSDRDRTLAERMGL